MVIREWWISLNARERLMIGGAAIFLVACLLYFILIAPFFDRFAQFRQEVPQKKELLSWMEDAALEVRELVSSGNSGIDPATGGSVMAVIDQTAKVSRLSKKLKRIEPDGKNGAKVWLEDAAYDNILRWIHLLETTHGIRAQAFSAESVERSGFVKARLTLVGAGS